MKIGGGTERLTGGRLDALGAGDSPAFAGEAEAVERDVDKLVCTFRFEAEAPAPEPVPELIDGEAVGPGGGIEKLGGIPDGVPPKEGGGLLKFGSADAE